MQMKTTKAQSALEFLTTYSWSILILSVFVAVALILSLSPSGQPFIASSCYIQPLLTCQDTELTNAPITYYMTFINNLQVPMNFTTNAINVTTTGIGVPGTMHTMGNCYPSFLLPGASAICKASISGSFGSTSGTRVNSYFTLSYYLCTGVKKGSCNTATAYKSSGYSVQTIAPANIVLYGVTPIIQGYNYYGAGSDAYYPNGTVYLNGVPYASNVLAYLPAGNYVAYVSIGSGYVFSAWDNGPSSLHVTSPLSNPSNFILSGSGDLIANITNFPCACSTCAWAAPFLPTSMCPATCPTALSCGGNACLLAYHTKAGC